MKLNFRQRNQVVPFHLEGKNELLEEAVTIDGTYLFTGDDLLELKGTVRLRKVLTCDLCLEGFEREYVLDLDETVGPEERPGEGCRHNGSEFDLDELIHEEFILALPDTLRCSDSCKGLCGNCGGNLNLMECSCEKREVHPKFQMLEQLLHDMKE